MEMEIKEGWSIDITNKCGTHYYRNGSSLCGKATQKFYMDKFDKSIDYSQVLGFTCRLCEKKLKKECK
jgi:abortive infection bacteriophage resistance protein